MMKKLLNAFLVALVAILLGAGLAAAQEKLPPEYGSIDDYPVPIGAGSAEAARSALNR